MVNKGLGIIGIVASCSVLAAGPDVTTCPDEFHTIAVHGDAKLCQLFDSKVPASMVYHIAQSPNQAIDYYLQDNRLTVHSNVHDRTLIMNGDKSLRVVVSPDGAGSQVDILVVSPQS